MDGGTTRLTDLFNELLRIRLRFNSIKRTHCSEGVSRVVPNFLISMTYFVKE